MDAASLIDSFATGSYTVTRTLAGAYVDGRPVPGAASTFTVKASVQPISGRDLLRLPEGRRASEAQVLFTTRELLVGGQGEATQADRVSIGGRLWEVQEVSAWKNGKSEDAYFRCMVLLVVT